MNKKGNFIPIIKQAANIADWG